MTDDERAAIAAIVSALHVPRDRYGRLEYSRAVDSGAREKMRAYALKYNVPHGGCDTIDQACMILQALIGDKPTSIMGI